MSPNPFRRRALALTAALALTTVSLDARTQGRAGRRPSPPSDNSAQKSPPDPTRKDGPLPAAGSWRLKRTLRGHKGAVYSAAFYPKGTRVATSGDDGRILVWDVGTGQLLRSTHGAGGTVSDVAVSPDGRLLASCTDSGE